METKKISCHTIYRMLPSIGSMDTALIWLRYQQPTALFFYLLADKGIYFHQFMRMPPSQMLHDFYRGQPSKLSPALGKRISLIKQNKRADSRRSWHCLIDENILQPNKISRFSFRRKNSCVNNGKSTCNSNSDYLPMP